MHDDFIADLVGWLNRRVAPPGGNGLAGRARGDVDHVDEHHLLVPVDVDHERPRRESDEEPDGPDPGWRVRADGDLVIQRSSFVDNQGGTGGAAYVLAGNITVTDTQVSVTGRGTNAGYGETDTIDQVEQEANLQMGWCISCHEERKVRTDCFVCHY